MSSSGLIGSILSIARGRGELAFLKFKYLTSNEAEVKISSMTSLLVSTKEFFRGSPAISPASCSWCVYSIVLNMMFLAQDPFELD